jgi:hypothetical protein
MPKIVDSGCSVFRQITWSVDDTIDTASQVRRHNARFAKLCPKQ